MKGCESCKFEVAIPSNRVKRSKTERRCTMRGCESWSQSPQIGSSVQRRFRKPQLSHHPGSRNPLKSGQAFKGVLWRRDVGAVSLSQSPQIGSSVQRQQTTLKPAKAKTLSQSPQIGSSVQSRVMSAAAARTPPVAIPSNRVKRSKATLNFIQNCKCLQARGGAYG